MTCVLQQTDLVVSLPEWVLEAFPPPPAAAWCVFSRLPRKSFHVFALHFAHLPGWEISRRVLNPDSGGNGLFLLWAPPGGSVQGAVGSPAWSPGALPKLSLPVSPHRRLSPERFSVQLWRPCRDFLDTRCFPGGSH